MLLSIVWSGAASKDIVHRLNYGIVFRETDKLFLGSDVWYHTFELDLPKEVVTPYLLSCTNSSVTCSMISHLITQLNAVKSEMSARINATILTIEELVPEAKIHKSRSKRALLSFIGRLSKGLFGTATVDDVNMLSRHINKISKMTLGLSNALVQHEDHLSSYMNTANKRMDNLMKGIKDNMLAIKFIQTELYTNLNNIEYSFDYILSILIDQIKTSSTLNHELDEFKLGIIDLVNGKLSPLLIPHDVLTSTINDIQTMIQTKFTGFHLSITDVNDVYRNCDFLFARNNTKLYVTLKLPISNFDKPVTVYQIMSVPLPINSTSDHATQILSLPNYFLITSNHQYYATVNTLDLTKCKSKTVKHCPYNVALTPVTSQSCVLALYANDKNLVKSLCEFRYVQSIIKPKIMEISPNSLLLYRTPLLSMQCLQEHKMIQGCDFCIFTLPCRCSISTNEFYLAPRLANCHIKKDNITIEHPVNLALLQHFFEPEFVNKIFADTTFKVPLNVSVPKFQFFSHEMSDIIASDNKAHLNLSKIAEATKNDAKIFQSLAEPLIDNQIKLQSDWPDLDGILLLCCMGFTLLLSAVTVWSVCKIRSLTTALLIVQKVQKAKSMATELPSFIYKSKIKTIEEPKFNFDIDISWDQANFMLLSILVLIAFVYLWRKFKYHRTSKLCLEIVSDNHCVFVDIHSLPMCPSNYQIQVPESITGLEVTTKCFIPTLHVSMPGCIIKNTITDESIHIPSEIKLNIWTSFKLKKILSKPFFTYLYTSHSGILSQI